MAQSAAIRPRRSVLYQPGSNARALQKGRTLDADALILDLEDAVAPSEKENARLRVIAMLKEGGYGHRELLLRVNGLSSPWGRDDLIAAATSGAHGVVLPKVESAQMVQDAERILVDAGAPDDLALWCMMETPLGVLSAAAIAASTPRLAGFIMGTSDLAKDLRCAHTPDREPMITALGLCLLAARAYNLAILDGVHLNLSDDEGFEASCVQGRDLGFDGKTLIHPKTLATANRVFAPSPGAIAQARAIIAAFAEAEAQGLGVVVLNGRLVENLHVVGAQQVLALAGAIANR